MELNADFTKRASAHADTVPWVASPMAGVERRMLDRIGDEVARATTVVRFAPGSAFSAHTHGGGEEYFVLDGVFQDETGDFPVGSYVRNPPTTHHTPSAADGATILVKLWQFDPDDRTEVYVDSSSVPLTAVSGRNGVSEIALFEDSRERVRIETWAPNSQVDLFGHEGLELYVLDGGFTEQGEAFGVDSWLRLPVTQDLSASTGAQGARVWIKTGHLAQPITAPAQPSA